MSHTDPLLPTKLLLARVFYHSNGNGARMVGHSQSEPDPVTPEAVIEYQEPDVTGWNLGYLGWGLLSRNA